MKVFISWSGELSKQVAELLGDWLPSAVPRTKTWLSNKDIEKGAIWFGDIGKALSETSVGIICLTRENKDRPWILFEAGGLNKGLAKSHVCPLLLDLDAKELEPPLKEFNATRPDKENMLALCRTINRQDSGGGFPEPQLEKFFNTFWPEFESQFAALLKKHGETKPPKRKEMSEMVEEILETVQALLRASQTRPPIGNVLGYVGTLGADEVLPYSTSETLHLSAGESLKRKPSAAEVLRLAEEELAQIKLPKT